MSNFFDKAKSGSLMGPKYDYVKQIKTPGDMGMSADGSIGALESDFKGLASYAKVLIGGGGPAQFNESAALGNKFFLQTGAKCKDTKTNKDVTRSIYINNVPDGGIGLPISNSMSSQGGGMKGLVPGILGKLVDLNPMEMFNAFMAGTDPECQWITMDVTNPDNSELTEKKGAFVINADISEMNPCWFSLVNGERKNPMTNGVCTISEGFSKKTSIANMPDDNVNKIYYVSLSLLLLFIFAKVLTKN